MFKKISEWFWKWHDRGLDQYESMEQAVKNKVEATTKQEITTKDDIIIYQKQGLFYLFIIGLINAIYIDVTWFKAILIVIYIGFYSITSKAISKMIRLVTKDEV